jgi:mono/diheme cytochrome c family protein
MLFASLLIVTFTRDVGPLFQRNCVRCHGRDGISSNELDLRTYKSVMRGGNIGDDVVPGKPDQSVIVHFIEGRRGPEHRMPLHSRPLTKAEVAQIRAWIEQGAKQ